MTYCLALFTRKDSPLSRRSPRRASTLRNRAPSITGTSPRPGGTAAITGAYVAAHDAVARLLGGGQLAASPITGPVAAVSVGIVQGVPVLDLEYVEDVACDTDMNVVMTGAGHYVEVQGTAEGAAFNRAEMDQLLRLAEQGCAQLVVMQREALARMV